MANNENNLRVPTSEEAREIGRKGGIKSGEVRKQKKLMRDIAQQVLEMPLTDGAVKDIQTLAQVRGANITVQQAILLAMAKKAMKGDKGAAEFVRDTAGQTVTKNIEVTTDETRQQALNNLRDMLEQMKK